jgi:2-keto-4-pentenoate hydratase
MTGQEFYRARVEGLPIPTLPSASGLDLEGAYRIENEVARLHQAQGHAITGRKVGYANRAAWRLFKLETLVWAHMFDDTVRWAPDGFAELSLARLRSPRLEPEIVVRLREPLEGGGFETVEWLALGFEILDCPYPDWKFQPADFVAAWGLHAALITGTPLDAAAAGRAQLYHQLADFRVALSRDGELVQEGSGRNCLRSPALCLEELARAASARGDPLRPGELISTGTLTEPQPVAAGQEWSVAPDGLPLAPLRVRFC